MKNYRLYGNAPYTAAVIHGGPGALGSVAAVARRLAAADFGVIEPMQTRTKITELMDELHETLCANAVEPIILIGHSWGAWLAWMYAAAYPARVKKLILVGSGPFKASYAKGIDAVRKSRLSVEQAAENDMFAHLHITDDYSPMDIAADAEDLLEGDGTALLSIWSEAARMRANGTLLALAKKICCPVIAIHGDYDPHPAEGVRIPLEKRLNNFQFYLLPRCGHSPWKEQYAAEAFYEIILNEL